MEKENGTPPSKRDERDGMEGNQWATCHLSVVDMKQAIYWLALFAFLFLFFFYVYAAYIWDLVWVV